MGNAIKHIPSKRAVWIDAEDVQENGQEWIKISVSDNGPGIPEDILDDLFKKYEQHKGSGKGDAYSHGLGLTFCKMAMEEQGGKIYAESELDKGSVFVIMFPMQRL